MLTNIGFLSYLASSTGFFILALLLVVSWRGRMEGGMLLVAVIIQAIWSGLLSYNAISSSFSIYSIFLFEIIRYFAWLIFMLHLLNSGVKQRVPRYVNHALYALIFVSIILATFARNIVEGIFVNYDANLLILILLALSITGLVLTEQIYRNVQPEKRWAIKFLCIGLGGLFAYDLYTYSDAILFDEVEQTLWNSRGIVNALIIPLIAISAKRNPTWSIDIFISRHVVFYSTGIMVVGVYLLMMSLGGYYIRIYGGEWGPVIQVIFFAGAFIVLFVILSSGAIRAKLRVFLSKHFYRNKYDYREEWLRLIHNISAYKSAKQFKEHIIQVVAGIMQCRGGLLFLVESDEYQCVSSWNVPELAEKLPFSSSLVKFLNKYEWIIDINEYIENRDHYNNLEIPEWIHELQSPWLIIPLKHHYNLIGFFIFLESGVNHHTNWEDRDLLKAVGRQVSSYLAFIQASDALAQAEQFDAFNRLSAYVVHDLKNLVSQLDLIVKNAEAHKENPEFITDSFLTVSNVVTKMQKMLGQLKKMRISESDIRVVDVVAVLESVIERRSAQLPRPTLFVLKQNLKVFVEPERFANIIEHLIQNSQEATDDDGKVDVELDSEDNFVTICVRDSGTGMTHSFIRDHLFRPFDTTKGNAGMGIGVYEVKEFVKKHNGYLQVDSTPGVGTTFIVKLPLGNEDLQDEQ